MTKHELKRRLFLQGLSAGALTASLSACGSSSHRGVSKEFARPFSRRPLVAPKISSQNIITQAVGHRP